MTAETVQVVAVRVPPRVLTLSLIHI